MGTSPTPPASAVRPIAETLHGVEIVDPFRWLEDGDPEEVRRWTEAQNAHTEAWLSSVPARAAIRRRLQQLLGIGVLGTPTPARGRYLYQRRDGSTNQPILYVRDGLDGPDRIAVDPNALSAEGTTALDWYHVSPDGAGWRTASRPTAVKKSVLQLLDLDDLSPLADRIPRTRSCDLAWLRDSSGFFYTRYPAPGSVPAGEEPYHRAVWFHRVGDDPVADRLVFQPARKGALAGGLAFRRRALAADRRGADVRRDRPVPAGPRLRRGARARGSRDARHVRRAARARRALPSHQPGRSPTFRLYAVDPATPVRDRWREIVPARPDAVLASVGVTAAHLVLDYLERATARLRLAALDGGGVRDVELPTLGSLFGLGLEPDGHEVLFGFSSFTVPPSVYRLDPATGATVLWRRVEADIEPERYRVSQVEYPSADGTRITMFLVHRRDLRAMAGGRRPHRLRRLRRVHTPAFSRSMLLCLEGGRRHAEAEPAGGAKMASTGHRARMRAGSRTRSTTSLRPPTASSPQLDLSATTGDQGG